MNQFFNVLFDPSTGAGTPALAAAAVLQRSKMGLLMHSRRGEYTLVGIPSGAINQNQLQLDAKIFF